MDTPRNFADAQDALAASLPGYSPRATQLALAEQIEQALSGECPGLMQAGTGTGKSLAILIPLIIRARETGMRSVVATATKALQNQYTGKDLPFLAEHLGIQFTFAALKGRANYPCQAKAAGMKTPTAVQRGVLARMAELSTDEAVKAGEVIDREDFPALSNQDWIPFSMSSAECPGKKDCPFARTCFAERAKARAETADIVVTNTAMLMQDLVLRLKSGGNVALLGEIGALAVDEGHTLPDAATSALEDTISDGTLIRMAREIDGYLSMETGMDTDFGRDIEVAVTGLWATITDAYADFIESQRGKADPMPLSPSRIITELGDGIAAVYQAIENARTEVKNTRPLGDDVKITRSRLMRRTDTWMERLLAFSADEASKTVRWVERMTYESRGRQVTRSILRSAPVSVAPFLRAAMWDNFPVIMSSATLTTGQLRDGSPDFGYLAETLGLSAGEALTFDAGSPFNFRVQSRLFVPGKGFPEPAGPTQMSWRAAAQAATRGLVDASGGGALLLFTSRSAMNESHQALAAHFRSQGLLVLRQDDYPPPEMVRQFRENGHAVMFGLRTFFEGIDIPGRALRLVVIDKLPFAVPTDLLNQARVDAMIKKYNNRWAGFDRLTIPAMILVLTQAFGRLIRHADDNGLVAILDPRLRSKQYGRQIMKALPPAAELASPQDAAAYLKILR
jgi:ATP-dependent DNA helicase DinG